MDECGIIVKEIEREIVRTVGVAVKDVGYDAEERRDIMAQCKGLYRALEIVKDVAVTGRPLSATGSDETREEGV